MDLVEVKNEVHEVLQLFVATGRLKGGKATKEVVIDPDLRPRFARRRQCSTEEIFQLRLEGRERSGTGQRGLIKDRLKVDEKSDQRANSAEKLREYN